MPPNIRTAYTYNMYRGRGAQVVAWDGTRVIIFSKAPRVRGKMGWAGL